jgi:hypothetical protein
MAREHAFKCPNCKALYQVVRVEAGPETTDREITCKVCGSPLVGQEDKFGEVFPLERGRSTQTKG